VDFYGDSHAVWVGNRFVDVGGEQRIQLPRRQSQKLVNSLLAKDFWSLRESYRANTTDNPSYKPQCYGDHINSIEDYVGQSVVSAHTPFSTVATCAHSAQPPQFQRR